ncbi:hypothetical protein DPMN_132660 [Dreissena polymorpha]|uniref:C2H2-type domain-containing protein n=1 Tax=Dreissena polymorpha TaxID=45954 RepID=A0A9D4FU90_DREPO|nr:hypothetical protein DPMN_132660 [Dreissena polymorpha]
MEFKPPQKKQRTCSHCEFTSNVKSNVTRHERVHLPDESKFQCDQCEQSFTLKQTVKNHYTAKHSIQVQLPYFPLWQKNPNECLIAPSREALEYQETSVKESFNAQVWGDPSLAEAKAKALGGDKLWKLKVVLTEDVTRHYPGKTMEWLLQNDIGMH